MTTLGYALLGLLAREQLSGYDLAQKLKMPVGFFWTARHSQIYPELARLEREGLVTFHEVPQRGKPDKKIYSLTEAGREEVAGGPGAAPWGAAGPAAGAGSGSLPKAGIELAQAAAQVGRTGSPDQVQQAVTVLEEARRRIYAILAQG